MEVGYPYRGGKPDDITVIVAQVKFKYDWLIYLLIS